MLPPVTAKHTIRVCLFDAPQPAHVHVRILLLKLDHIGDFITAIDGFRILRRCFPDAEITLICLPSLVALAHATGLFDIVLGFSGERDSAHISKAPHTVVDDQVIRFAGLINGRYFLAADFRHDAETRHWLDYVDADYRAGFAAATRRGLDIVLPVMEWDVPPAALAAKNLPPHAATRLTLLAHAIVDSLSAALPEKELFTLPDASVPDALADTLNAAKGLKIGLSVGAGSELKKWPIDYWVTLTRNLLEKHNAFLIFFGGIGDQEDTLAVLSQLPPGSCLDITGAMPLERAPAVMNRLDGYIGCDTGLTHLAARLGLPTVNIFAGTAGSPAWRARGPKVKTVYAEVICAPCHLRFKEDCPNKNVCMTAIVPGIVYDCFENLML